MIVAIIQARMGSTRLPGKVLKDICGETMLARVVNRVRQAVFLDQVVVATTSNPLDDAIVAECERLGVSVLRGSELDVLDRYYQVAKACGATTIVRICADCPLIDPTVIDQATYQFLNTGADFANLCVVRTYPIGLDFAVMTRAALTKTWRETSEPYHREHVTAYIYQNPDLFKLQAVTGLGDYSDYNWAVNTPEELDFVRDIYAKLKDKNTFSWYDVLALDSRTGGK